MDLNSLCKDNKKSKGQIPQNNIVRFVWFYIRKILKVQLLKIFSHCHYPIGVVPPPWLCFCPSTPRVGVPTHRPPLTRSGPVLTSSRASGMDRRDVQGLTPFKSFTPVLHYVDPSSPPFSSLSRKIRWLPELTSGLGVPDTSVVKSQCESI